MFVAKRAGMIWPIALTCIEDITWSLRRNLRIVAYLGGSMAQRKYLLFSLRGPGFESRLLLSSVERTHLVRMQGISQMQLVAKS